ncbi:hypothetical protein CYMTET_52653 [Cymbomonas tetramitiformis]|uniref:Uncharacterized protein n=1 Tax=Cymbomonas tetramitiformis TaxID=36881 RepID=A0AAE0EQL3_9CHLO|nr:hypothetical protein CYMTET_52653 [Cymbomonas tetramitiformis]
MPHGTLESVSVLQRMAHTGRENGGGGRAGRVQEVGWEAGGGLGGCEGRRAGREGAPGRVQGGVPGRVQGGGASG